MSRRLIRKIDEYLIKAGRNGRPKLCVAADVSMSSLANVLGERRNVPHPLPKTIYKLALACGCAEEEALELVLESAPDRVQSVN